MAAASDGTHSSSLEVFHRGPARSFRHRCDNVGLLWIRRELAFERPCSQCWPSSLLQPTRFCARLALGSRASMRQFHNDPSSLRRSDSAFVHRPDTAWRRPGLEWELAIGPAAVSVCRHVFLCLPEPQCRDRRPDSVRCCPGNHDCCCSPDRRATGSGRVAGTVDRPGRTRLSRLPGS